MKSIINCLAISLLLPLYLSCTTNVNCDRGSLHRYAQLGEIEKLDHCFQKGTNLLFEDSTGVGLYNTAKEAASDTIMQFLRNLQLEQWQKEGSPMDAAWLYKGISFNNGEIVQQFAEQHFELSKKYFHGMAPIVEAIFDESYEVIPILLDHGVDVGYEFDFRPLIAIAAMFGQENTIQMLLDYGADVNDMDGSGVTPLMFAAQDGNRELVEFLISQGADKSMKDIKGQTALDRALTAGHEEMQSLLQPESPAEQE